MKLRSLSLILVALLSPPASFAATPPTPRRVAVLDFSASWAAECVAGAKLGQTQREQCEILRLFADQARGGALTVLRPPGFIVMTRENTAQILKDMGGQCTEGECEVETARLLGASVVVSGEVNLLEGTFIVSLKVHDVATAALLGTGNTEAKSKLEAFRNVRAETERMLRASAVIEGTSPPAPAVVAKPAPPPPAKKADPEGLLVLDVTDEDAQVLLDGKEIGTGPLEKELKLLEGTHQLVVMKAGFFTYQETVKVEVGGKVKAKPRLVAVPAPQASGALPAPPEGVSSKGRRWWGELLLGIPVLQSADPAFNVAGVKKARTGIDMGLRGGFQWTPSWSVDATIEAHEAPGYSTGLATYTLKASGFTIGGAWRPKANPYLAVAVGAGILSATTDLALNGAAGSAERSSSGTIPCGRLELRGELPLRDFSVGLQVGVLLLPVGSMEVWSAPLNRFVAFNPGSGYQVFPLQLSLKYRFL